MKNAWVTGVVAAVGLLACGSAGGGGEAAQSSEAPILYTKVDAGPPAPACKYGSVGAFATTTSWSCPEVLLDPMAPVIARTYLVGISGTEWLQEAGLGTTDPMLYYEYHETMTQNPFLTGPMISGQQPWCEYRITGRGITNSESTMEYAARLAALPGVTSVEPECLVMHLEPGHGSCPTCNNAVN